MTRLRCLGRTVNRSSELLFALRFFSLHCPFEPEDRLAEDEEPPSPVAVTDGTEPLVELALLVELPPDASPVPVWVTTAVPEGKGTVASGAATAS